MGPWSNCQNHVASPSGLTPTCTQEAHWKLSPYTVSLLVSLFIREFIRVRVSLQVSGASDIVSDIEKLFRRPRKDERQTSRRQTDWAANGAHEAPEPARRWADTTTRPASTTAHWPPRPPELIKAANTAGHADNAALSCVQNSFN